MQASCIVYHFFYLCSLHIGIRQVGAALLELGDLLEATASPRGSPPQPGGQTPVLLMHVSCQLL
jgi:hypothetical protein